MPVFPKNADRLKMKNFAVGYVDSAYTPGDGTVTLRSGEGANFPTSYPFPILFVSTQALGKVTNNSGDVLTFTALEGSSDVVHNVGEQVIVPHTAGADDDHRNAQGSIMKALASWIAGDLSTDGILNDGNLLVVSEQGTPDFTVQVAAGVGILSGEVFEEAATASLGPFTLPSSDSRIDIVQYTLGTGPNIKQGTAAASPVAPSPDADSIVLAEVLVGWNWTHIGNADITNKTDTLRFN